MPPADHDPPDASRPERALPVAVTYRSPLFNASEGFVQAQALGLRRYRPVVCGRNRTGPVDARLAGRIEIASGLRERLLLDLGLPPRRLAAALAAWRPALIHAHFATDGLAALPLARRLGIPIVTSLRGYDLTRSRASLLLSGSVSKARYVLQGNRLRRQGTLFLPVSAFLRDMAIAQGFPEERTLVHYNGVDLDEFAPGDPGEREELVLHVGRLAAKKGTSLLLRAFARCGEAVAKARLVVLGDGPLRESLQREARSLGIADRVEWLGMRPHGEVAQWLRRARLLVAPSLTGPGGDAEGLPNVVVEAAASGVPVLATRHAGIPEAVHDGRTGLLVPENDLEPLAAALERMLADPATCRAMGRQARALAEERFDYRRQMERLEEHYDAVVAQRGAMGRLSSEG